MKGIYLPSKFKLKRDQVLLMSSAHIILTVYEVDKNSLDTWVGKPKGILDIFYVRGLLDLDQFDIGGFNEKFQKDSYGKIIEGSNLYETL